MQPIKKTIVNIKPEIGLNDDKVVYAYRYALCKIGDFENARAVLSEVTKS